MRIKSVDFVRIFLGESDLRIFSENSMIKNRVIPIIGALIVFVLSFSVLYAGDNVGLSDNGDFRRVLLMNNIEYEDETDKGYLFKEDYKMLLDDDTSFGKAVASAWRLNESEEIYKTPHFLIIRISKVINVAVNTVLGRDVSDYNIMYMALLYISMLSLAAWVVFTFFADLSTKLQVTVFALFLFIFCDAGYLLYFNSFYGEPLQYTALMMLIAFGMLIYKRPSVPKVAGFFVSLYFFAGAKLANVPYSLVVALLAIVMVVMREDKRFKVGVVVSAVLCIASIIAIYVQVPSWMNNETTYQAVFLGITKDSDTPEKDLAELGVDPKYAVLAGTHANMDEDEYPVDVKSEEFERDFYDKVGKVDIALFYVKHPVRLIRELSTAIEHSAYIRPPGVGNSETMPMDHTEKFSGWSRLRITFAFLYTPWFVFTVFGIITLYMIFLNIFYIHNHKVESPQRKYMICSLDILVLGLWANLILPIVGCGQADIAKHMFLFVNCMDILFVLGVTALMMCSNRRKVEIILIAAAFTGTFHISSHKKTVKFGEFMGKPVKWQVVQKYGDGTTLLVTKDCVAYMPFDDDSNSWTDSDVRQWLNGDFLSEFSSADMDRIVSTENKNILTYDERDIADGGDHAHFWNFTKKLVNDMGDTAYYNYTEDKVFIPTLNMLNYITVPDSYWVMCPYTSNGFMERFMNEDGFILHTDVRNEKGVRAVIRIEDK